MGCPGAIGKGSIELRRAEKLEREILESSKRCMEAEAGEWTKLLRKKAQSSLLSLGPRADVIAAHLAVANPCKLLKWEVPC